MNSTFIIVYRDRDDFNALHTDLAYIDTDRVEQYPTREQAEKAAKTHPIYGEGSLYKLPFVVLEVP